MRKPLEDVRVSEVTLLAFIPTDAPPATIGLPLFDCEDFRDFHDGRVEHILKMHRIERWWRSRTTFERALTRGVNLSRNLEGRGGR
jgi:hypothetical protein